MALKPRSIATSTRAGPGWARHARRTSPRTSGLSTRSALTPRARASATWSISGSSRSIPGKIWRLAESRPSVLIPDFRIAYDALLATTYFTGRRYLAAVPSAWGEYITEPSPIVATTVRPGDASWTPSAVDRGEVSPAREVRRDQQ